MGEEQKHTHTPSQNTLTVIIPTNTHPKIPIIPDNSVLGEQSPEYVIINPHSEGNTIYNPLFEDRWYILED